MSLPSDLHGGDIELYDKGRIIIISVDRRVLYISRRISHDERLHVFALNIEIIAVLTTDPRDEIIAVCIDTDRVISFIPTFGRIFTIDPCHETIVIFTDQQIQIVLLRISVLVASKDIALFRLWASGHFIVDELGLDVDPL